MTTTATHSRSLGRAYPEVWPQTPLHFSPVGNGSCRHSLALWINLERPTCGLCFLKNGYSDELPAKLHLVRTLADNGNPQQTDQLQGHLALVEGIYDPQDLSTEQFSRARSHKGSHVLPHLYPFTSAIWHVMGKQPPLGIPLHLAIRGFDEVQIAGRLDLSLFNVNQRLAKGVDMAAKQIRKYDGQRERHAARSSA